MKKLLLIIALFTPISVIAEGNEEIIEIDNLYYFLYDSEDGNNWAKVTYKPYDKYSTKYPENIIIPSQVTYNGRCYNVTTIGKNAFYGSEEVYSFSIPNSVAYIEANAFHGCSNLKSIEIPNSVTSLGEFAFDYCSNLTSVILSKKITTIPNGAFHDCIALKSISMGDKVDSIGNIAFYYCKSLESISLPNSLTVIGSEAFHSCSNLESIVIPNRVTYIGPGAFENCFNLESIDILNSFTYMGYEVFDGTAWFNNQPDGMLYIAKIAYRYKGEMPPQTSLEIKDGTVNIACAAFMECYNLISVTIPNSVSSISGMAFQYCTGLTSVIIPNSVTSIEDQAFYGCKALKDVYCYAENCPTTGNNSFVLLEIYNATLHVPGGSIDVYKSTEPWSRFKEIVAIKNTDPKPTRIITLFDDYNTNNTWYDLNGRRLNSDPRTKGVYILNGKKLLK